MTNTKLLPANIPESGWLPLFEEWYKTGMCSIPENISKSSMAWIWYEAIRTWNRRAETPCRWVGVKERLPDLDPVMNYGRFFVLRCGGNGKIDCCVLNGKNWWRKAEKIYDVTHWLDGVPTVP